jgi:nucleotide-binding universal stress UspA family protein
MSYKDLLVVLDSDAASRRRIDLAAGLAERFAAHLVGLYPLPVPEIPHHLSYYDPAVLDPFFMDLRQQAQAASDAEREAFEHAASLRGLSAEWRASPKVGTPMPPCTPAMSI